MSESIYLDKKIIKAQNSIVIIDNYIKDQQLLLDIENDESFFPKDMGSEKQQLKTGNIYHSENADIFSPWMFWDGWWNSPADTVKKRLIQAIWEDNLPCDTSELCGFEYWTRKYSPGQYLPLHLDEDTFLYEDEGKFRCPMLGAVYYAHMPVRDDQKPGYLEMHPGRLSIDRDRVFRNKPSEDKDFESLKDFYLKNQQPKHKRDIITYRPNRLILFDAGMLLHGTTPSGENSERYIVGINVWHKLEPPTGYEDKTFYFE